MELRELIKIIKTKDNWNTTELIEVLEQCGKNKIEINFCWIGGYECMKDGTKSHICRNLLEVQEFLDDHDIEYDDRITNPHELVDSIECDWEEMKNDGGGRGWIEY